LRCRQEPARAPCTSGGKREGGEKRNFARAAAGGGKKKKGDARIRKRSEEGQMEFSKGLYIKSENCRDLFVKQNFPLI
jgi:hypothetical protein